MTATNLLIDHIIV